MGMEIYLKPMEYNCLMVFAKNPNKALTRNQILQELWNEEFCGETRTVDAHVVVSGKNLAGRIRLKQFPESVTDLRWIYETLNKDLFQTTCIILLASSGIFLYTTYCWKNQSIQNINSYESSIFRTNILQFENKTSLSDNQKQNADNEMRPQIVTYAFRQVFHDSAVLYLDGKMTYNGTVYEFDVKKLRELCASKANMVDHGSNSDGHGPMISQINGRTLLLFYYGNVNMGYQIVTYKDITDVIEKSHLLFFQTGGFTLSLIVVMGIILYLSLRKITAPLTGLREATLLVSEGIYDFKVPSEGNTELAQIGATFNFMTGKIKEQIESLSNINRTQKQLIGSLAHELKTPMTAIIGYADTLLTVRLTPERQEKALIYIENECRRLSRLSMKMLELTGLYEASEDSFNPAEIQVDNFLKEVKELIDCRLQEKNISLDVFCEPKELVKKFDQDLMISVVTNLIDNAVKASRKESKIVLEATPDHLMVQDFGKGIPKEDLEMVTEPFYMVDKSRSRAKGSVGLGLSLCQKIIELHDFQLKIESNPGKGTTVSVFW